MHPPAKGPRLHRMLIGLFSVLLTLLFIWLLGFITSDIDRLPGPQWDTVEAEHLDAEHVDRVEELRNEQQMLDREITAQREIQANLQESTLSSQQTMNQLLEMHRLYLQQDITPTTEEQQAMAESQTRFLENQRLFQEANQEIAELSSRMRSLQDELNAVQAALEDQRRTAREAFDTLRRAHSWRVAAIKLGVLVPLLLAATWLVVRSRTSPYLPIAVAAFVAAFWRVGWTMHQHFPREYFKYIAIATAILVVLALLVRLIRMMVRPQPGWLLRRYREAYARRTCPVCAYEFQGVRGLRTPTSEQETTPYACPSCGTDLFSACSACGKIRHTLLPHCSHCGTTNPDAPRMEA